MRRVIVYRPEQLRFVRQMRVIELLQEYFRIECSHCLVRINRLHFALDVEAEESLQRLALEVAVVLSLEGVDQAVWRDDGGLGEGTRGDAQLEADLIEHWIFHIHE